MIHNRAAMTEVKLNSRGRRTSRTAVLMVIALALATLGGGTGSAAHADEISLDTGSTIRGVGRGAVDMLWRVSYHGPEGRRRTDEPLRLMTDADRGGLEREAGDGASPWLIPAAARRDDGSEITYYTTFHLSKSQAAAATIDGRWSAGVEAAEVALNGTFISSEGTEAPAPGSWHELHIGSQGGFHDGVNVLEFHVLNASCDADAPSHFRFEGRVSYPSKVPEPATLILSTASTLILAGLSWKRRLARHKD